MVTSPFRELIDKANAQQAEIKRLRTEIINARERMEHLEKALRRFADMGDPNDYPNRPRRLDLPFEWFVAAYEAIEKSATETGKAPPQNNASL